MPGGAGFSFLISRVGVGRVDQLFGSVRCLDQISTVAQ